MAFTYQSIVDQARKPLNDADKARYSDADLLNWANHALLALVNRRPDIFIGQLSNLPTGEAALTDTFPLPPVYVKILSDYVTSMAEMVDDEHANSGRAQIFMQMLNWEIPS